MNKTFNFFIFYIYMKMYSFSIFYMNDNIGIQIIKLIQTYKLNQYFKAILVTSNEFPIYLKYLNTIPLLIDNKSNLQIDSSGIIEFIVRLNIYITQNDTIPYYQEPSLYSDYYSKFNNNDNSDNKKYYSSTGYHNINNKIPLIKIYTEDKLLTIDDFDKKYKKLMDARSA